MAAVLENRVDALERYMMELAYQARRTEMEVERLSAEMREFKEEMRRDRKEMNRRWGDLANKMGTLVEDIFAPGLPAIARKLDCERIDDLSVRRYRRNPDDSAERREFDIVAVCPDRVVLVDVKSSPRLRHVEEFAEFVRSGRFFEFFPELRDRSLVPVFGALYLPDELVERLTREGIYALSMGDEHLELRNAREMAARQAST